MNPSTSARIFFLPLIPTVIVFALTRILGRAWDTFIFQSGVTCLAVAWGVYLVVAAWLTIADYNRLWSDIAPSTKEIETPEPVRTIPNLNAVAQYRQVVRRLRLDSGRKMAYRLIAMRENNMKIDLTESLWIPEFESAKEFRAHRDRWARNLIVSRVDPAKKNSSFYVLDWEKMKWVADGKELPVQ